MASTSPMGPEGFPGLTEISTSTDYVFAEDVDARAVPRGPISPPDRPPGEDPKKDKGKKKPEPIRQPVDSEVLADPGGFASPSRGTRRSRSLRRRITTGSGGLSSYRSSRRSSRRS